MPIIAATITAAATVVAAIIAPAALSGGGSRSDAPPSAASTEDSETASASPGAAGPSASPSDRPVDKLPSGATNASTPDARPRVVASPDMAATGAVVTLTISGFAPGDQLRISFSDTSPKMEVDMRDVIAGPDGGCVAEVKVPADRGDGYEKPRFRVWSVSDVDTNNSADTPFTYLD
ncbi:hypothetical protein [Streptomyces laculatispora]|uniref:hypothetical protein n=1 Tax=Streptomyces laculatispora TaxID=887464 RepID=UPI001A94C1C7|nr:hypothetical protein [Streptomyces laculatispora]MBO0916917.1 hypothetical protein [Streptomyces laculatispora]